MKRLSASELFKFHLSTIKSSLQEPNLKKKKKRLVHGRLLKKFRALLTLRVIVGCLCFQLFGLALSVVLQFCDDYCGWGVDEPLPATAYPSTPCLLPSSPALPFPRPSPGGLQTLGFGRHRVPVTATQLCHCSVEAPVTVGMSLFVFKCSFTGKTREREQAGLGLSLLV